MKVARQSDGLFVVSLVQGETIRAGVEAFAKDASLGGARVWAIGGIEEPELGFYDLPQRRYLRHVFGGPWELLSFDGNIALLDGRPVLHAHAVLSDVNYHVRGGHFFDARVGIFVEMFIEATERPIKRRMDEAVGLPGWVLEEEARL